MDRPRSTNGPQRGHLASLAVPGFVLHRGVHAQGTELPRHSHDDPTICYVLRGRFTEYTAGHAVDCVTDSLKVMPAGEPHWNRFAAGETRGLRVDVDRSRFDEATAIHRLLGERLFLRGDRARDLMGRLLRELEASDDAASLAVEGLLLELLATLSRESRPREAFPAWLREADAMVRELYATSIALGDVARAVGVTPATLARAYRAEFRMSLGERVRRLRIEAAARELLASREPLAAIAARAGFYDQSHFTGLFRRYVGVTPAEYRRRGQV
jgi:AraC family transcriptional regulator